MPAHHGKSGTSAGVAQGQSSTSGGQGRQDPEGGYAPEHKYSKTSQQMATQGPQYQTGRGRTGTGTKGTISTGDGVKNVSLAASFLTKNPYTAAWNLISRIRGKKKDTSLKTDIKGIRQDPKTGATYHKAPRHRPVIDQGGDGMGGTQMAATSAQATQPVKPVTSTMKPYYMGFDFQKGSADHSQHGHKHQLGSSGNMLDPRKQNYQGWQFKKGGLSGGERFGPPPKKGPNPHGKCPFRPDGIRGVGAVEKGRGVKFIGTK